MLDAVVGSLRLLAVPLFGWAALRDIRTRRVPNWIWYLLGGLGALLLVVDLVRWYPFAGSLARLRLTQVAVSLLFVAPLGYLFWRLGGFGGADAKALMALAVLYPAYPTFFTPRWLVEVGVPPVLPVEPTALGVFSLTILTNTVVVGASYPLALAVRNAAAGEVGPQMFLARVVPVDRLPTAHGRLFETHEGFTRGGLDIDALRMYLRWRGLTLAELRAAPSRYRPPSSVTGTYDPTDGAVDAEPRADGGTNRSGGEMGSADATRRPAEASARPTTAATGEADADVDARGARADEWAAERFLDDVDGSAYGTDPETLREGLETVVEKEDVWISPGLPFIVPMFVGLVVALTYGDLLFGALLAVGLV